MESMWFVRLSEIVDSKNTLGIQMARIRRIFPLSRMESVVSMWLALVRSKNSCSKEQRLS